MTYSRFILVFSGLNAAMAIALAAWGRHNLSGVASDWIEIASFYQLIHGVALAGMGYLLLFKSDKTQKPHKFLLLISGFWIAGLLLFSGSLTSMAVTNDKALSFLTPIGGICFILGWCCVAISAFFLTSKNSS